MSDDENQEEEQEVEETVAAPVEEVKHESKPKPAAVSRPPVEEVDGKPEAELRMELERKKRQEREQDEWKEYEEQRKAEREKEEEEIRTLKEKKESRKIERAEQEKRLAELRAVENEKKRAEEEERQRRKKEEEQAKREERERKQREAEERTKKMGKPNFVVTKKGTAEDGSEASEEKKKQAAEPQKSKEQLESEKRAVLEQRVQPLKVDGFNQQQLSEKAKDLYQQIYHLECEKYDLEQRFKRQQCDIVELAERARQVAKGGKQKQVNVSNASDPMSEKIGGLPKVVMYSQYERVKDPRTFNERQELFTGPSYSEEYIRIHPQKKIIMTEQGAKAVDGDFPTDGHNGSAEVTAE